ADEFHSLVPVPPGLLNALGIIQRKELALFFRSQIVVFRRARGIDILVRKIIESQPVIRGLEREAGIRIQNRRMRDFYSAKNPGAEKDHDPQTNPKYTLQAFRRGAR